MLHTRLWVGTLLALAAGGVLLGDAAIPGPYPFLFLCVLGVGSLATWELALLVPADARPRRGPLTFGVLLVLAVNWVPVAAGGSPWEPVLTAFVAVVLGSFLLEMAVYRGPGVSVPRITTTIFTTAYLGLLASGLVRIRFDVPNSELALAAAIFVPKCGDIGAYLFGRLFGRHKFSPRLSPKKTWEGFIGGMAFAVGVALLIHLLGNVFRLGWPHAVAFGLLVGLAGVLGDLAESMIKRDAQSKDASAAVPGFGGVLDVIDSVLFAAPVAYLLLRV